MEHSLRLSIKWPKKWESQKEIILSLICCLLWIYPSLEKQTIRPALNVDSISPDLLSDFPRCLTCTDTPLSSEKMGKRDSSQFILRWDEDVITAQDKKRQKGIYLILSQLHFFLETQFLLYDHIILSQIIWHHDPRFIWRFFGLR